MHPRTEQYLRPLWLQQILDVTDAAIMGDERSVLL